ncbi:DUF3310 domain-containing protein [Thalassobacillus sp. CUG 92003]|uniref:DUF3310 domain-containing protein n=1 Tax=Thalassobacillus sp. CUG 92003 TaxID=2736641 RepID=UPI0015E63A1A|nr:DUF3310 domain-containing protein [Thalassobacillus sp. CUG 92003]
MEIRITESFGFYKEGEIYETIGGKERSLHGDKFGFFVKHEMNKREGEAAFVYEEHCGIIEYGQPGTPDVVSQPSHYTRSKFETIEIIEEITQGYDDGFVGMCVGNALKYLARAPYKHAEPSEDLAKATKYIEFATEYLERKENPKEGDE